MDLSSGNTVSLNLQKTAFKFQIELVIKYNLPLIFHIRNAEEEAMDLLNRMRLPKDHKIHRHCFMSDVYTMTRWLNQFPASKISITNIIMLESFTQTRRAITSIKEDQFLFETDSPFMVPKLLQSTHNMTTPAHIIHVAVMVAKIKETTTNYILHRNKMNIKSFYRYEKIL